MTVSLFPLFPNALYIFLRSSCLFQFSFPLSLFLKHDIACTDIAFSLSDKYSQIVGHAIQVHVHIQVITSMLPTKPLGHENLFLFSNYHLENIESSQVR